jgi:hypothetical protein
MGVEKRVAPNSKGYCSMANWLSKKDEQFKEEFEELLANDSASTASLYRFLADNADMFPGLTSFKSHRNKWCSCGSKG